MLSSLLSRPTWRDLPARVCRNVQGIAGRGVSRRVANKLYVFTTSAPWTKDLCWRWKDLIESSLQQPFRVVSPVLSRVVNPVMSGKPSDEPSGDTCWEPSGEPSVEWWSPVVIPVVSRVVSGEPCREPSGEPCRESCREPSGECWAHYWWEVSRIVSPVVIHVI